MDSKRAAGFSRSPQPVEKDHLPVIFQLVEKPAPAIKPEQVFLQAETGRNNPAGFCVS